MEKMKMVFDNSLTFEEGCELYLDSCRIRNLREGTINHYKQSYTQFYKFFDRNMLVSKITQKKYNEYILFLRSYIDNDVSINAYLRDFITTMHFLMREGYLEPFPMRAIKVDKPTVTTYTDAELRALLKKPNLRECNFMEYECWVITNLLFSTGIRQRSLIHLKVKDIDFDNHILHVNVTKNRKALLVSLSATMIKILEEFLKYRQHTSGDDPLFCSVMGNQMTRSISYKNLYDYNKGRGVETTGLHRYRHTFAKQWVLNGGNVVSLSKILGHSSLQITQNYINLLISDVTKEVDELSLIDKFTVHKKMKLEKIKPKKQEWCNPLLFCFSELCIIFLH